MRQGGVKGQWGGVKERRGSAKCDSEALKGDWKV